MTRTVETKFYTFDQNNSGGYYVGPQYVFVEAQSAKEANALAEFHDLLEGRDRWCECCGERWSSVSESDGYEQPSIYGRPITGTDTSYLIRYYDGRTERREVKPND